MQRGVPDVLFTGDGAALELRVLRAVRGVQFLGPYSRFGWSHPGPAYFYLASPFYELFGERGPALNLFAMAVQYRDGGGASAHYSTPARMGRPPLLWRRSAGFVSVGAQCVAERVEPD